MTKWLKDHWLILTTVAGVTWGGLAWAFGVDKRVSVVEEKVTTQQHDIRETKQLVRDIHNHLLNRRQP